MEAVIVFMFVRPSVLRAGAILLLLNGYPANFMFVIVTKVCPLDSITEALNYFMTIFHEIPFGLKKIQKLLLQEIETCILCGVYLSKNETFKEI
jgi:hypothetical protein